MESLDIGRLILFLVLTTSIGCGGGGGGSAPVPPAPTGTVTAVHVSATGNQTAVNEGSSLQLAVAVSGTGGAYSSAVSWSVSGPTGDNIGSVSASGVYAAPALIPAAETVIVTAASAQDPQVSGTLSLTVSPAAGTIASFAISPSSDAVTAAGATAQFQAIASGTGYVVSAATFSVNGVPGGNTYLGTISAGGLYTAPAPAPAPAIAVTATSIEDPSLSASASVDLNYGPPAFALSPPSGQPGDTLTFDAQFLAGQPFNALHLFFPSRSGTPIEIVPSEQATAAPAGALALVVPQDAASGYVTGLIEAADGAAQIQLPGRLAFTRAPTLRIHTAAADLSEGETTQVTATFVGGEPMVPLDWSADLGNVNDVGVYQAPALAGASQVARITACVPGTTTCDTVIVQVLPLRIAPTPALASQGLPLALSALQGGLPITAQWSIAGPGEINATGTFTPAPGLAAAGAVAVTAAAGGSSASSKVIVTGAFPGQVNRVGGYQDLTGSIYSLNFDANYLDAAANSRFLFVCSEAQRGSNLFEYFYFDVYDLSDPRRPEWVNAFEAGGSCFQTGLYATDTALYQYALGEDGDSALYTYRLTGAQGSLVSQADFLSAYQDAEGSGAYFGSLRNGVLYAPGEIMDLTQTPAVVIPWFPNGDFHRPIAYDSATQRVFAIADITAPNATLEVWKAGAPPRLLGQANVGVYPWASGNGAGFLIGQVLNLTTNGWWDVSGNTPTELAPAPATDLPYEFVAAEGSRAVTTLQRSGCCQVYDYSSFPPTLTNSFYSDDSIWDTCPVLRSGYAYCVMQWGGLGIFDLNEPGGLTRDWSVNRYSGYAPSYAPLPGYIIESMDATLGVFSNNGAATPATSVANPGNVFGMAVCGSTLYAVSDQAISVWDASDPPTLLPLATLPQPGSAIGCSGNRLYVATLDSRLVEYDVSQPSAPAQIAQTPLPDIAFRIATSGPVALVADGAAGLLIYADGLSAAPLATVSNAQAVTDVAADGDLALLAAWDQGLEIVNLDAPAAPRLLSTTPMPADNAIQPPGGQAGFEAASAYAVAVENKIAYVGLNNFDPYDDGAGMIPGIDYSDPVHPRLVELSTTSAFANNASWSIGASGAKLYVSADIDYRLDATQPYNFFRQFTFPAALLAPSITVPFGDITALPPAPQSATIGPALLSGTESEPRAQRTLTPAQLDLLRCLRRHK